MRKMNCPCSGQVKNLYNCSRWLLFCCAELRKNWWQQLDLHCKYILSALSSASRSFSTQILRVGQLNVLCVLCYVWTDCTVFYVSSFFIVNCFNIFYINFYSLLLLLFPIFMNWLHCIFLTVLIHFISLFKFLCICFLSM